MTDNRDPNRPHGETGDIVQQAADVFKPVKPAIDVRQMLSGAVPSYRGLNFQQRPLRPDRDACGSKIDDLGMVS
jgi:hypothetical protein